MAVLTEPLVLELYGEIPSKKNSYKKRSGRGRGMFKDRDLQSKLDYLTLQIPAEARGLELVHPDMRIQFIVPDRRRDRDNLVTALLDVLVVAGVLKNDNIASFNGRLVIEPAEVDQQFYTRVTLIPKEKTR